MPRFRVSAMTCRKGHNGMTDIGEISYGASGIVADTYLDAVMVAAGDALMGLPEVMPSLLPNVKNYAAQLRSPIARAVEPAVFFVAKLSED